MNVHENDVIPLNAPSFARGSDRARRADAAANRELILATAQALFAEQGVADVCMAAIAQAAGVGKGTLYRGFANKGELCLALMDEDMRVFQNKTLELFREIYDQPALDRLGAFLEQLVRFMDFHAPLLREAQRQGVLRNDEAARRASPHYWLSWLHETIGSLLRQAQESGEAQDLDIPYLVDAILAPLSADLLMFQREVLGFELERISRGLRHLVLRGCRG